jgi:hypothetical protein
LVGTGVFVGGGGWVGWAGWAGDWVGGTAVGGTGVAAGAQAMQLKRGIET